MVVKDFGKVVEKVGVFLECCCSDIYVGVLCLEFFMDCVCYNN